MNTAKRCPLEKRFEITQTSPHSHIPAEQGDERLAGNLNTCRLQGFSSAIEERPEQQKKKKKKKGTEGNYLSKHHLSMTGCMKFGIWKQNLCEY